MLCGSDVREVYLRGRGSPLMRGVAHIEELQPGKGRHRCSALIITELPFQLSKASWIEKLAEQVNERLIKGIADIRDESGREGMRVVIELRRNTDAKQVLSDLQRRTSLQRNFGAIMLALVNGQPRQLSLRQLLKVFLEHRELTLVRRIGHALCKIEECLEVVEGLISTFSKFQEIVSVMQQAVDAIGARTRLMMQFKFSQRQADTILAMPLRCSRA